VGDLYRCKKIALGWGLNVREFGLAYVCVCVCVCVCVLVCVLVCVPTYTSGTWV